MGPASKKNLLQRVEDIYLNRLHGGCRNIFLEFVQSVGGMNDLTKFRLRSCSEIECLIDTTSDGSFQVEALIPGLVKLELEEMENLKELCHGSPMHVLRFFEDGTEDISPSLNNSHSMLPNLKKLSIHHCLKLEFVFPSSCVGLEQLQELEIFKAFELKYIFGHYDHKHHSAHQNEIQSTFPVLKSVKLQNLANPLGICRGNNQPWWPSLKELSCWNCPKLSTACIHVMVGSEVRQQYPDTGISLEEEHRKHLTSLLERLELRGFSELRIIWPDLTHRQILSLQYLQYLKVDGCAKLKSVFSMMVQRSLPELTSLVIQHCEELQEIIPENEESHNLANNNVCFPKLRHLTVKNCNKLKSLWNDFSTK